MTSANGTAGMDGDEVSSAAEKRTDHAHILQEYASMWKNALFSPNPGEDKHSRHAGVPEIVYMAHTTPDQIPGLMNRTLEEMDTSKELGQKALPMAIEQCVQDHPRKITVISIIHTFDNADWLSSDDYCQFMNRFPPLLDHRAQDDAGNTSLVVIMNLSDWWNEESLEATISAAAWSNLFTKQKLLHMQNHRGETAAHIAVTKNQAGHLQVLIRSGANLLIRVS